MGGLFDSPNQSYSLGGILTPGSYALFLWDDYGDGGISGSVTTYSGQTLTSWSASSYGQHEFMDFTVAGGGYSIGLMPESVHTEQTAHLNNVYNDMGYNFEIVSVDTTNNSGWYYSTDSFLFDTDQFQCDTVYHAMTESLAVDPSHTLNYYWTGVTNTLGFAIFPWIYDEGNPHNGLFCGNYTSPGGSFPYNEGDTGVHEVGHYVGLYHVFENGCDNPGDEVDDTAYQMEPLYGCPSSNYSCGSNDPVNNFMNYVDDACMNNFSNGQIDRINWALETYRPTLIDPGTLYSGPVWHVTTTGSDSSGVGSEANPFATIQSGIDAASDGDTVLVGSGTYVGSLRYSGGFSSIEVMYPDIVTHLFIISESGPDSTIIIPDTNDVYGYYERAISVTYEGNLHLDGFTITESTQPIFCGSFADGLVINNCIIKNSYQANNSQQNNGQIIQISEFDDTVFVFNTLVYNCTSNEPLFDGGYNVIMENVTIVDNHGSLGMGGGGVYGYNIKNSIIRNNIDDEGQINNVGENVLITYTDWEGGYEGDGNINSNPLFCNPDSGDYTLAENSPALGSGEGGANMGAFGVGCGIQVDWDFSLSEPVIEVMGTDNVWNPGDTISVEMDFCNNTDVAHNYYPGVTIESDSSLTSLHNGHIWFYAMVADECHAISWGAIANTSIISDTIITFSAYPEALNCQNQPEYCINGDTVNFEVPIVVQVVSAEPEHFTPEEFVLHQNYPNPFNPITTLRYDLPETGHVNITIYDMLGREVKTLINLTQNAGRSSVHWDATNDYGKPVSAGIYLYQIQAGEYISTKKMVLLK